MFQKKLARAQSKQAKNRKRIVGYSALAILVALLASLFTYLAVQLDVAQTKLQEAEQARPQESDIDTDNITTAPQTSTTEATPSANSDATSAEGQAFSTPLVTETPSISSAQDTRGQFLAQLAQYESDIEPKIDQIQLHNWDGEKYAELNQLKARAIEYFSQGEYLLARETVQQARALVAEVLAQHTSRLETAKRQAQEAFEHNQAPEAKHAIQQALRLSPADSEMLALQKRVDVLPQVLDLLRQAGIAENENRPEKEVAVLQKVLSIDPARSPIKSRLEKLRAQLKQQQFSNAVSAAQNALNAGNLADAKKQIAVAKTIFPSSEALVSLQNQLQQAQAEKEFAAQMALGKHAVQSDDWQTAAQSFGRAQKIKPNDKAATDNYNAVQKVIKITQKINTILAKEQQLGDQDILDSVFAYLREVESVIGASPRLQKSHAELTRLAELYKIEVDVVVVSDNKTHIVVRGQGQVGKTSSRTIRLRPGRRVFEGARSGYKSTLVTLDIKPGVLSAEVTVICDEKL